MAQRFRVAVGEARPAANGTSSVISGILSVVGARHTLLQSITAVASLCPFARTTAHYCLGSAAVVTTVNVELEADLSDDGTECSEQNSIASAEVASAVEAFSETLFDPADTDISRMQRGYFGHDNPLTSREWRTTTSFQPTPQSWAGQGSMLVATEIPRRRPMELILEGTGTFAVVNAPSASYCKAHVQQSITTATSLRPSLKTFNTTPPVRRALKGRQGDSTPWAKRLQRQDHMAFRC